MLGLEGYGSDDSDSEPPSQQQPLHLQATSASSIPKTSSFSLPPPTKPLPKKSKRPVFTVAKPSKIGSSDEDGDGERPPKRPRLDARTGAGSSSLLAMLPAPSKTPLVHTAPPRVLGSASQGGNAGIRMPPSNDNFSHEDELNEFTKDTAVETDRSTLLVPPSLAKGKAQDASIDKEAKSAYSAPAVDFFSLGPPSTSSRVTPNLRNIQTVDQASSSSSVAVTSAPTIPTFEPPIPTPSDPYPGYYQLPSGQWAAHDPEFYRKYYEMWSESVVLDEASPKGFEGAGKSAVDVDAQEQLDLARKEREEKKSLTKDAIGGRAAPKMNIKPPKIGSRARVRHQLSALLTEAYENREALEEKIAQGRRNRKEAGNKYGF